MAVDNTLDKVENTSDVQTKAPEQAAKEADEGKGDLVNQQKAQTDYLKAGGHSGITGEFGKPLILDDGAREKVSAAYDKIVAASNDGSLAEKAVNANAADKPIYANEGAPQTEKPIYANEGDYKTDAKAADGQMGLVGDRSKDSGLGKPGAPELTKDDQGRVTDYKLPNGDSYHVGYGADGQPNKLTMTPDGGAPKSFEKNAKGEWVDSETKKPERIESVSRGDDGAITIQQKNYSDSKNVLHDQRKFVIGADGSFAEKELKYTDGKQKAFTEVDPDGTTRVKFHDKDPQTGKETGPELERTTKPGSHMAEVKDADGKVVRHEQIDDQGHATKIEKNADGTVTVTKGDKQEKYDKMEGPDEKGDIKLSKKDNSTAEMKADGTEIHRDKNGKANEITNADGEKTTFKRDASGKVTEATVTNADGKVVEKDTKGITVNDKDGSYTVEKENGNKLERKADGTERELDKNGKEVETESSKLLDKFKNLTPEQREQLKQDLAEIDKLPKEQREKVYESLNRIARNDEHPDAQIHLTGQQARELTCSLAHQIAHPESIQQGDKMTCTVANAEQTMAKNHPEVYADMVSKLATDGKYTTAGGKTIEAQKSGEHELAGKTDAYGQRSYSSELFQNGVTQLGMKEGDTYKSYGPDDPALKPRPAGVDASTDTGERVVHKDGTTEKFNGYDADKQAEIMNQLAPGDKYKPTEPIQTPADLEKAVKDNKGTPLNVGIHLGPESGFTGMSGDSGAAGSGYHAVNITRIETGPDGKKYVYYNNPAGGIDHSYPKGKGVPIDEFVKSMQGGNTKMRAVVKQGN